MLHRVHGAARPGPHGGRRQDLPQGPAGLQGRYRRGHRRPWISSGIPRPWTSARNCRAWPCPATRSCAGRSATPSWPRPAATEADPVRQAGTAEDRRGLPPGAGPRAPGLPGGAAVLLVLPPRRHHRAERLGRLQPRPPGPAPLALLPARAGRTARLTREQAKELLECFFVKFNNHTAPAKAGRDRGGERHLHRLRQHQPGRPAAGRLRRLQRAHPPAAGDHRRDAPAAAQQQRAGLAQDPGRRAQARPAGHPQRLRLPVPVQRRRGGRGTAPPGQDPGGRPGGRLLAAAWKWGPSARRPTSSPATST